MGRNFKRGALTILDKRAGTLHSECPQLIFCVTTTFAPQRILMFFLSQAMNFSNSANRNFVHLFGFWRRNPIWLVIDFFSTSCHSQLLLVVTAKIMFYVEILPFTWKRIEWENGKEISISNWLFCREYEMYLPCMISIFWTLEVRGWISFLSSGNFELQVFLLTYCHILAALH